MSTDDHTSKPSGGQLPAHHAPAQQYRICVSGHLGQRWTAWFDGMTLTAQADGTTVIRGPVVDQAALHGLLQKLRDLGIDLRSLTPLVPDTAIEQPNGSHNQTQHHSAGEAS